MADYEYTEDASETNFDNPSSTNFEQTEEPAAEAGSEEPNGQADGSQGEKINASKNEDDERKIFVGGLSWETNVKDMKEYFSKFGDVADCTLKTDPTTGRSRGFGFVLFATSQDVDKIIAHKDHVLHGRNIDPKRANPRGNKEPIKKVFVGGLDPDVPEEEIRSYFGDFGKIEEIDLPYDKIKGQRRAFCFITFESEAIVDKCCENQKHTVGTKEVDVKKATPKDQQGGFGGRGRGWGFGPPRGRGSRGRGGYNQGWGNDGYGYDYYNQGYGGYSGYDYNQGYGTGYDYNNYYNQGWGNYNQSYGSGYGNGGYGNSGYGGGQSDGYGKPKRGGSAAGSSDSNSYHPYSR